MAGPDERRLPGGLRRLVYRVHFAAASAVGGATVLLASALGGSLAVLSGGGPRVVPRLAHAWGRFVAAILGWRIVVENREALARKAPVLFVGNHQSNLDVVVFGSFYPARTVALGKKEVGRIPFFGWFFVRTGNILVDRGHLPKALVSLRVAAERMEREGLSVFAMPEGHRSGRTQLLPFKKGPFHLALAAGAPVVPIVAEPFWSVLDAHRWMVRPGTIRVKVLPDVPTAGLTEAELDPLVTRVKAVMQEAFDAFQAEGKPRIG